ncbi:translation initiation factor IF-2 [Crocinitomicaceae bacterium]|nr:translation initiation factor IF-2 [Crocinitomicaceae bacterium]
MAKPIRLGKAAGELNVGMSTLVEFLASKEVSIDASPNTKLTPEQYAVLRVEFAADQSLKELTKQPVAPKEKKETVSLKDSQENTEEPAAVAPVEEPKTEEVKSAAPEIKTVESNESSKLQVLGTIDLDKINSKTRPDKKKKPTKEAVKPIAEKPVEKPIKQETKTEEKPKETLVENPVEKNVKVEPETIRVERKKLSGPNIVGKIVLPVEKPKTSNNEKRKRKRVRKIDVAKKQTQTSVPAKAKFKKTVRAPKPEITEKDIQKEIKDTLARLSGKGGKSKGSKNRKTKRDNVAQKRMEEEAFAELDEKTLKLTEFVTVSELATMMNTGSTDVISACMTLGIFVSINQRLDAETIQMISEEFGYDIEFVSAEVQDAIPVIEDNEEDLISRPPIITVMGHVDHGKTSLLDRVRDENVTDGEAGGITQHIGAYNVTLKDGRKMTFLDTPGHEAFTAMRARGAQITDVAVIIIAADDDVMPQTKEAISHAQAAEVPMVFAINKVDKPGSNADKIKEQLSTMNILVEEWGGKYQCQEISAKQNLNIDELLEKILLEAEMLDLKANPNRSAVGTVIESSLDIGKGYVTNMLIEKGTLRIGDVVLVGRNHGKIKAMHDEHGNELKEVTPAMPVSVLGINGAPSAGDTFHVMTDEKEAKSIASKREQLYREQGLRTTKHITLDEIGRRLAIGDFKELNLIVKGDVDGSIEALSDALLRLSTEQIQLNIVHKGVGAISEADVNLANASEAIIIGFQVRPTLGARKMADSEQIDVRLYSVIYKAIDEIKAAMEGMLSPDIEEKIIGTAEIRETFDITKVGTIAGCFVTSGLIKRNGGIRIIRDGIVVHTGTLGSLKRFKDDVREVKNNYECGLNVENYNDLKVGDVVESYEEVEVARKLK